MRRRLGDLFTRLGNRDGQALLLIAGAMALILIVSAFVVDVSHAFVDQRHLQNTADAASLAAAQQLASGGALSCATGTSPGDCATEYVVYNNGPSLPGGLPKCTVTTQYIPSDPSDLNCYQNPYYDSAGVAHQNTVLVWLYQCTSTFFGGIVGIHHICESVRSVSEYNPLTHTTITPPSTSYSTSTSTIVQNGSTSLSTSTRRRSFRDHGRRKRPIFDLHHRRCSCRPLRKRHIVQWWDQNHEQLAVFVQRQCSVEQWGVHELQGIHLWCWELQQEIARNLKAPSLGAFRQTTAQLRTPKRGTLASRERS